jgi:hypothetical protein
MTNGAYTAVLLIYSISAAVGVVVMHERSLKKRNKSHAPTKRFPQWLWPKTDNPKAPYNDCGRNDLKDQDVP